MKRIIILLALVLVKSFAVFAHGGEDDAKKAKTIPGQNYFTVSTSSDVFELVLRYEPIDAKKKTLMKLFVSDFETNAPIDKAQIEITSDEDSTLKFIVKQIDKGIYSVETTFPDTLDYALTLNIYAGDNSDLMTLEGIKAGKKLPMTTAEIAPVSTFDFKNILYLLLAFAVGIAFMFLVMRKKISARKTIAVIVLLLTVSSPLTTYQNAYAHNEDTGEKSNAGVSDEVTIPKETQFLFDVRTAKSIMTNNTTAVKLYGKVMPATNGSATILSPQNGSVSSLNVSIGQRVGKGQVLAVIEQNLSATEQIQLATEISNAAAEYDAAKKEYDRLKSISDIVAQKDLQAAEIRFNTATQNKKVYDALSGGSYENKKLITIKSPIEGAVDNFNISIGQQVNQGMQLFNIYDVRKLKVEAQLFANYLNKIGKDATYFVEGPQEGTHQIPAKLLAINNAVSAINQSSQVVLEIDNSDNAYKPGQFVTVDVLVKSDAEQLVVPTSAMSDINGKPVVFTHHQPETFKVMYVQTGQSNAHETVILKGLKKKERVVSNSTYEVKSIFMNQ